MDPNELRSHNQFRYKPKRCGQNREVETSFKFKVNKEKVSIISFWVRKSNLHPYVDLTTHSLDDFKKFRAVGLTF